MKIVSVVPNSAVRDARIVKQAKTLRDAGHQVNIVGIMESQFPSYRTQIDGDINVYRVPHSSAIKEIKDKTYSRIYLASISLGIILLYITIHLLLNIDGMEVLSKLKADLLTKWAELSLLTKAITLASVAIFITFSYFILRRTISRKISAIKKKFTIHLNNLVNVLSKRKALKDEQSKLIIDLEPELIYCHEVMSLPACVKAKNKLNVPLIYDAHEFYDSLEGDNIEIVNAYNEKSHFKYLNNIDSFVTVSETILSFYQDKYEQEIPKSTTILPNSIIKTDVPEYDGRLHEAAKIDRDKNILLFQGGVSRARKVHEIVEASADLPKDWVVVLMGKGKEIEEFERMADQINEIHYNKQIEKYFVENNTDGLEEHIQTYFDRLSSLKNDTSNQESIQALLAENISHSESESRAIISDKLNIEKYAGDMLRSAMNEFSNKSMRRMPISKKNKMRDDLLEKINSILWETEKLSDVKLSIHKKQWDLAKKLALYDVIINSNFEFNPRVKIIDPVPQEELLLWTQGATIGAIPYPITCENHWGCAPNKLWEYPGAGVPIIATPTNEMDKIIRKYNIGWTISSDPKAKEIVHLIKNLSDEDIKAAKQNCKKFIKESNWQIHSKPWLEMIKGLK